MEHTAFRTDVQTAASGKDQPLPTAQDRAVVVMLSSYGLGVRMERRLPVRAPAAQGAGAGCAPASQDSRPRRSTAEAGTVRSQPCVCVCVCV